VVLSEGPLKPRHFLSVIALLVLGALKVSLQFLFVQPPGQVWGGLGEIPAKSEPWSQISTIS